MEHSQDKSNEEQPGQLRQAGVMPSRLSRSNTCIRCGNAGELHYVLKWAEAKGRKVDQWMWDRNKFPFMVFFEPGTKHLGWNDCDDRNCDIVPFVEAIGICDWA